MKNENHREQPQSDVIYVLKGLRPATSEMDPTTVFYQAGFQAGQHGAANHRGSLTGANLLAMIAAVIVTAAVTVPASYRIGKASPRTEVSPVVVDVSSDNQPETATINLDADVPDLETEHEQNAPVITDEATSLFASWVERLQPSRKNADPSQHSRTLAVAHTSYLSQHSSGQPWPDFGVPDTALKQNELALQALTAGNEAATRHTFAVGDTGLWAQVLEVSR